MTTISYELNHDCVEVHFSGTPYVPGYTAGLPEHCYPDEGGEIEIEEVEYRTKGKAFVDGKWIKCDVKVDVSPLLTDGQLEDIEEKISTTEFNEYD
jgi:hypothetical protein